MIAIVWFLIALLSSNKVLILTGKLYDKILIHNNIFMFFCKKSICENFNFLLRDMFDVNNIFMLNIFGITYMVMVMIDD